MKVLITGAGGQLGRALVARAPRGVDLKALRHSELDVTLAADVRATAESTRPDWILNAAAFTDVDGAERTPAAAFSVNGTAVETLARAATGVGARFLHPSTDFVFDGQAALPYAPDAPTAPLGVYGASKLAGERHAREAASSAVIIRTSWLYAAQGRNFVRTMLELMRSRPALRVIYDQVGAPTWVTGLADVVWQLVLRNAPPGIYHWRDGGVASWYDFAVAIQEEALERGLLTTAVPIEAVRTADYPTSAHRPPFSVLDIAATVALLGQQPLHWRVQLRKMLNELAAA
jgi:dTDP-4-dehydrorhamnose reductase